MPKLVAPKLVPRELPEETIGQRIARIRKQRGLTQKQLAEKLGINRGLVTDYEIGRARIYDEMLARIALALKVSSDELLGIKNSLPKQKEPSLKIAKRMERIGELPPRDQKLMLRNIDIDLAGLETQAAERGRSR